MFVFGLPEAADSANLHRPVPDHYAKLALDVYKHLSDTNGYQQARSIAEELYSLGVEKQDSALKARGLCRLAYCEIRFNRWRNSWEEKLAECERLCQGQQGTRHFAEMLMFRGHLVKWLRDVKRSDGIADLKAAIVIASQIEDDVLLSQATYRLAELCLLGGHPTASRGHAIYSLQIAEHTGHQPTIAQPLHLLTSVFYHDDETEMALPYARRLLSIEPENRLAQAVVSRVTEPKLYIKNLREELAQIPASGLAGEQHDQKGRLHNLLARCLLHEQEVHEALQQFLNAAVQFRLAGNDANYVDTLVQHYCLCVENGIPITDAEPFLEMIEKLDYEFQPRVVVDIIRILDALDRPGLAAIWRQKLKNLRDDRLQREHERAFASSAQKLELELARRELASQMQAEQRESRITRLALVGALVVLILTCLLVHLLVNRRALKKLQAEVRGREAAQAKSEKLSEQLLQTQKLDALGTLSAGIAHDFNNTLHAITLLAELVRNEVNDGTPEHEHLNSILEVTQQGTELTRSMLIFTGRQKSLKSNCNLVELVRETGAMTRHIVPASINIKTRVNCSTSAVMAKADESQIKQVLMNLIINSRDAMPDGGQLSLTITQSPEMPGNAKISVSDDGCGMSSETMKRIFEPFFTTKNRGKGTGLGMSMAHGIIEDHGGTIHVTSKLGHGTTIDIMLPTCVASHHTVDQPDRFQFRSHGDRVLLSEDDTKVRAAVKAKLERLGFHVLEAEDGLEALEVYAGMEQEPDLILMDIDLPRMNGRRCVDALREKGAKAPAIFMTGLPSNDSEPSVLAKPFSEGDLVKAIQQAQEQRPALT